MPPSLQSIFSWVKGEATSPSTKAPKTFSVSKPLARGVRSHALPVGQAIERITNEHSSCLDHRRTHRHWARRRRRLRQEGREGGRCRSAACGRQGADCRAACFGYGGRVHQRRCPQGG